MCWYCSIWKCYWSQFHLLHVVVVAAGQPTPHHAHGVPHEPVDFHVSTGPPAQTLRYPSLVCRGLRDLQWKEFIWKKQSIINFKKGFKGRFKFLCTTKNAQSVWKKTFPYQKCNSKCPPCSRNTSKYCQSSLKIFGRFSQILYSPTGRPSNVSRGWKVFLAKYKSWSTLEWYLSHPIWSKAVDRTNRVCEAPRTQFFDTWPPTCCRGCSLWCCCTTLLCDRFPCSTDSAICLVFERTS